MMKWFPFLLSTAALGSAADFVTGQAARVVLGQPTFTATRSGASENVFGGLSGLAYANDTLFVVDANRVGAEPVNHRVLLIRGLRNFVPEPTSERQGTAEQRCTLCTGRADTVLGQPAFGSDKLNFGTGDTTKVVQAGLRVPTAVATDGVRLAVADTDNNRVLLWNSIPQTSGQAADLVVGQANFTTNRPGTSAETLRGPQGVWIQNGRLYVADTLNDRVLIWRSFPTRNAQPADLVLGKASFTETPPSQTQFQLTPRADNMINPVSVTSDGVRLLVTDLGHNRLLVWNSIPDANRAPADLAVGQPDVTSAVANNSSKLCESTGKNSAGADLFPRRCAATLDFPRYALSDGQRLFIADSGNDRVLVFNAIPTRSGVTADAVLGQASATENTVTSELLDPDRSTAANALRTPMSLASDGINLYVSDPYNRRIMVYSRGERLLSNAGVRNAASILVFANGTITIGGQSRENDELTVKIGPREYKYKIVKDDTLARVVTALANKINENAGDPDVIATANTTLGVVLLSARAGGEAGNLIEVSTSATPADAQVTAQVSGATLSGGQDAARIAPGSLVTLLGESFSEGTAQADLSRDPLPTTLADTQVIVDGLPVPLIYVSPTQINAQIPYEVSDATSVSVYVRTRRAGQVVVSAARAVPIVTANPGIFALDGPEPRIARIFHASSFATGTVSIDGTPKAGDIALIKIEDCEYRYTVQANDTLDKIREELINRINANEEERVTARKSGVFNRIRLAAKAAGPDSNGIPIAASVEGTSPTLLVSALSDKLCCASTAGAPVTEQNPAVPGETLYFFATGLGLISPIDARNLLTTGYQYTGPELNEPNEFIDALAGGRTAQVLAAGAVPGTVGLYRVEVELNSSLPTDPLTSLRIAQGFQVSNVVAFPVVAPPAPE